MKTWTPRLARLAVLMLIGAWTIVAGTEVAVAAGPGQYGAPAWFPLRGSWVIGCTWSNGCSGGYHNYAAIDIARNPTGSIAGDAVYAAGAGLATVYSTGSTCGGTGTTANVVQIDHGNNIKSYYYHLSGFAISGPTWVDENTVIGFVGHTGNVDPCTFNHLHFEVRNAGIRVGPDQLKACHGGQLVTYPSGSTSWNQVPLWTAVQNDGTGCVSGLDQTHVSTIVSSSGAVTVFARGADNALWTFWQSVPGGSWNSASLGGSITDSPSALLQSVSGGQIGVVFARGTDGHLWTFWQSVPGGSWNSASLGGSITDSPSGLLQSVSGGQIGVVFARGTDGHLWTFWQSTPGGSWNSASLGGSITDSPSGLLQDVSGGQIGVVFARGADGQLWSFWQTSIGGTWASAPIGGSITNSPSGFFAANGGTTFARGTDGHLWTFWQSVPGGSWNSASLGGSITGSPDCLFLSDLGTVFARGTDGNIWTFWQSTPGGSWNSAAIGSGITDSPAHAVVSNALSVYERNPAGHLGTYWQSTPGGSWNGPADLGGSLGQ